jgi:hypothetical protein
MRVAHYAGLGGALLAACLVACTGDGTFTLVWSLAGEATPEAPDSYACASQGVNGIQVQAVRLEDGEPVDLAVFPCAPHRGTRTLPEGQYELYVSPLDASGARLADPHTGQALLPQIIPATLSSGAAVELHVQISVAEP